MVSRKIHTAGMLAGILRFAVIGLSNAPPVSGEATYLAIRNPDGTCVAEYADKAELVKRVNVELIVTTLGALDVISYTA